MKNKRLLAILIVFITVCTAAVLGGAVFTVDSIQVNYVTRDGYLLTETKRNELKNDIIGSLGFTKSSNVIFSLDRGKIRKTIENNYWQVRLEKIDIDFPNRLVITVRERFPVYRFEAEGRRVIFDGYLRAINVMNAELPLTNAREKDAIDISDQLEVNSNFALIMEGDYLAHYLVGYSSDPIDNKVTEDGKRRMSILTQIFPFFEKFYRNEDSIREYFGGIRFGAIDDANFGVMFRQNLNLEEYPDQEKNNFYYLITVEFADKDFIQKFEQVWLAINKNSPDKTGSYVVTNQKNTKGKYTCAYSPVWTTDIAGSDILNPSWQSAVRNWDKLDTKAEEA